MATCLIVLNRIPPGKPISHGESDPKNRFPTGKVIRRTVFPRGKRLGGGCTAQRDQFPTGKEGWEASRQTNDSRGKRAGKLAGKPMTHGETVRRIVLDRIPPGKPISRGEKDSRKRSRGINFPRGKRSTEHLRGNRFPAGKVVHETDFPRGKRSMGAAARRRATGNQFPAGKTIIAARPNSRGERGPGG